MNVFPLSKTVWTWLICLFTAMAAILLVVEARQAFTPLVMTHEHGTLGATLDDHLARHPDTYGRHTLRILQIEPDSPLLAYGAQVGDQLRYDRVQDRWRRFRIGEPIGLTLIQPKGSRHLTVSAVASPVPFFEAGDYVGRFILAVPALLFSLLIGIKQGGGPFHRALAMTFCSLNLILFISVNYSAASPVFYLSKLLQLTSYPLLWYWCAQFALKYQPYPANPLRNLLRRVLPVYRVLAFVTAAYGLAYGLGLEAPFLLPMTGVSIVTGLALSVISMADGWRQSSGEVRQRHHWLLLSFALGAIPALLSWIPELDSGYQGMRWISIAMFVGQLCMYVGLAYAVLRHRVFNFHFAISRMVVFSVISILLLSIFGLVERLSSTLLHGGGHADAPTVTLVIDSVIALLVYLVFHHVHGRVERWVERIFFHEWHENEHKLRHYVRQAAYITSFDALLASYLNAVDRFTGQAGCAVYLRQADGSYQLAAEYTLTPAPAVIDTDSTIAVALRSEMTVLHMDSLATGLPADLAIPMSHRGTLNGFTLVGGKRNGESYRPDELDVLGFAAHQIGLDLHAIRVEVLEHEVRKLAHQVEQQDLELLLMAGRRKTPRTLPSMQA